MRSLVIVLLLLLVRSALSQDCDGEACNVHRVGIVGPSGIDQWTGGFLDTAAVDVRPEDVGIADSLPKKLDVFLNNLVASGDVPGATVAITRYGKLLYFTSVGKQSDTRALRSNSMFRIGTMSRMVTAIAVMKLVEDGKLLLTDQVSKYIPAFVSPSIIDLNMSRSATDYLTFPSTTSMTIHHLLTHTSGLSHAHLGVPVLSQLYRDAHISAGLYNYDEKTGTTCEMSARLARLPLLFEPGAQYHEGANYEALQCIIKIASGRNPIEYITDSIFKPLGMRDTHFYVPPGKVHRVGDVYAVNEEGKLEALDHAVMDIGDLTFSTVPPTSSDETLDELFSGGLVTTATDWLKLQYALLHGSGGVLGKRTVDFMLRNHVERVFPPTPFDASQKGYGSALGCFLHINPAQTGKLASPGECFTGGFLGTYSSIDRQEQMVVVFMTQKFGFPFDIVHRLQSIIMSSILE